MAMNHAARFGLYVRYRRLHVQRTMEHLAEISGLAPVTLSRIENGSFDPKFSTLIKLSKGFREPLHIFLEGYTRFKL